MEVTASKISKIILGWGIKPDKFYPTDDLLAQLGDDHPMTCHRFFKILRGKQQPTLSEAKKLAEWLEVATDEL